MSNGASSTTQSAVIRARYMPDVRGVNRPLIIDSNEPGCNIDKKPRELPYIDCSHEGRRSPGRTEIELVITSNVEDGRHRSHHSNYVNGSTMAMTLPQLSPTSKQNGKAFSKQKKARSSFSTTKTDHSNDDHGLRIVRNHSNSKQLEVWE
ncbi:hypothetical protein L596_003591 [Steinernema carpocapsae]|uniref:Uncharacterized protein n=1 Tax=Steinernema carpocapsae TaxID=34508 RepID=A0A4V6I7T1_STECR|nr:hypothetical protein L596_003591 [Steinernema carpocapsae]